MAFIEAGNAPSLKNVFDVIAQRTVHELADAAAKQQRDGEHDDGEDGLRHHQHMTPTLAHTAAKSAAHDVDGLVAAENHGWDKASH